MYKKTVRVPSFTSIADWDELILDDQISGQFGDNDGFR